MASVNVGTITISSDGMEALTNWFLAIATDVTTLVGDINNVVTTVNVADASNITTKNMIAIDNELFGISAKNVNTLTVARAGISSAAASHSSGAKVRLVVYNSVGGYCKQIIKDTIARIIEQAPPSSVVTQNNAINTAKSVIETIKSGAVS